MGKRLKNISKTNVPVLLFATFLVVGGIVTAAYFSSKNPGAFTKSLGSSAATVGTSEAPRSVATGTLWLADSDGVTIMGLDGASERLAWDAFISEYPSAAWPSQGSLVTNGTAAPLLSPEQASGTQAAFLSPDRRYVARMGSPKPDGAAVIEVIQGHEKPQSLVIRDRKGRRLSDTQLLGWLDSKNLAITATATSSRNIYAVTLDNALRQLAPLPDQTVYIEARAGAVWYATAVMGEGIESPPQGPSDLHRIGLDSQDETVAHEDSRVFQVAVPGPDGKLMYAAEDGQAFFMRTGDSASRQPLGERRPLLILKDGTLVLCEGTKLVRYDPLTMRSTELGPLPEGRVKIFESR